MTQITILDHVEFNDGSTNEITATVTAEGAIIHYSSAVFNVSWETMDDVEHLSVVFADTTVRVFKVVIRLLGKAYRMQDVMM